MRARNAYRLPEPDILPRGVHLAPYRDHGRPVMWAIDRHGDIVASIIVRDERSAGALVLRLWCILEHDDPRPPLALA